MPLKQFVDTSGVSIAYGITNALNRDEFDLENMAYVPYTTEGFTIEKDSQTSTAIRSSRRTVGSKNTQGSASGSVSLEFGYTPFCLDMLSLALMSDWQDLTEDDGSGGQTPTGSKYIIDGDVLRLFSVEKRIKNMVAGRKRNMVENYFCNLVNEMTLEMSSAELMTMTLNTMAAFASINSADSTSNENAGTIVNQYDLPEPYEIADASNNVDSIKIFDEDGEPMEVVFSDLTLTIGNNVREQNGIGYEFAAGMAMGKVNASLGGTVYYEDDTVLKAHLDNLTMSAEFKVETDEGTFTFKMPRLKASSPAANAEGENQDLTQDLTLTAEAGTVSINGEDVECMIYVEHQPAAA